MSIFFYLFGGLALLASVMIAIAAPSDIQLTMAAVFFFSGWIMIAAGALLWRVKENAESLGRIEHFLATRRRKAERQKLEPPPQE